MREIDLKAIKYISKQDMMVLRSKTTGAALNVSYSEDGLKCSTDKNGIYIYYDSEGRDKADNVIVEKFIPQNHSNMSLQTMEFLMIKKAYKMLYSIDEPYKGTGKGFNN